VILGCVDPPRGTGEAIGIQTPKKQAPAKKKRPFWRSIWSHFGAPEALKIAVIFSCFFEGTFGGLVAHLGGPRAPKEGHLEPFGRTFG